jgi:transcriptional regulator with XRE-family HTH domain
MDTYDRIQKLCEANSTTISAMCKAVGINRSVLTELKSGRSKSLGVDKIAAIADYFKVSTDYLLGRDRLFETGSGIMYSENGVSPDSDDPFERDFALYGRPIPYQEIEKPATDNDDGLDEKRKEWLSLYEKIPENRRAEYAAMLEAALKSQGLI